MVRAIQRFEVSLKAFIADGERALFVREADTGYWELPGGRIDVGEEWDEHAAVLSREVREELGPGLIVSFDTAAVTWVRRRPSDGVFQFIVARPGQIISGEPALSAEHIQIGWFTREQARGLTFPPESSYAAGLAALWRLVLPI